MQRTRIFALLLALCLCLGAAVNAQAADWSEEYYRANDYTNEMSDAQIDDIDQLCIEFVTKYHLDLALLALSPEDYDGISLEDAARNYYASCGFGYGETKDGFVFCYDAENGTALIVPIGAAEGVVPERYLDFIAESAADMREKHGVWGVMYAACKHLTNFMEEPERFTPRGSGSAESTEPAAAAPDQSAAQEQPEAPDQPRPSLTNKPAWFPADPQSFAYFHDENAPRVVDGADIFTDAEEKSMEARITELRRELRRDIVICTDVSSYGLSHMEYADDFYDYHGYGYGDEREGFCLFICMEEGNRGFWTSGRGTDSMSLQTETVANALDDVLIEYLADQRYGEGAANWIENIAGLYRKGIPFAPDWYPDRGEEIRRFHDDSAPRVYDEAELFTQEELDALEARAAELKRQYGFDVAILGTYAPSGVNRWDFARTYYERMGYGTGDGYDGFLVAVFRESDGSVSYGGTLALGGAAARMSDVAEKRLDDHLRDRLSRGAGGAAASCLDEIGHMLKTGRVPRTTGSWIGTGIWGVLLGSIFGLIALGKAKRNMKTVQMKENADTYLVKGSLRVNNLRDDYIRTSTTRRHHPRERSSGGGSSSGRSSYSSSHRSSSGAMHSGSGRRF